MQFLKSELVICIRTIVYLSCLALSVSTRRVLHNVSEDLGCLKDLDCNGMDVDEWEDVANDTEGLNGPNDDLEISHAGEEYQAVHDYYLMRQGR